MSRTRSWTKERSSDQTIKRVVLTASILGSGIVFLDQTIVNVALPAIRSSLNGSLADQQWVVEAYLLTLSSLLLLGGSLGDVLGRRRVFQAGLIGFGVCSLVCAAAPSSEVLIAARGMQGVAGALLVPSSLALILDTFGEGERAAAIGTWTAWTGIATVIGPLGGGLLVQAASWRWIFLINPIPVVITVTLLRRLAPDRRAPGRVDWVGGLLCVLGLGGTVFGLIEHSVYGWGDPRVFVPLIAGILLIVAFLVWERRVPEPMMPLQLFAVRNFAVGNVTTLAMYGGLGVATFFLVVFLQQVAGYTPLQAGLALLPITLVMFTLSRRAGALADRLGPRLFMSAGPALAGIGLLLLTRVDAHPDYLTTILPGVLVFALGLAATVAPLTATVLGSVEPGHSGLPAAPTTRSRGSPGCSRSPRSAPSCRPASCPGSITTSFAPRLRSRRSGRLAPARCVTSAPGVPHDGRRRRLRACVPRRHRDRGRPRDPRRTDLTGLDRESASPG